MEEQRYYDTRIRIPFNKIEELFHNGWVPDIGLSINECSSIDWVVFVRSEDHLLCNTRKKKLRLCNIEVFGDCCCKEFVGRKANILAHVRTHSSKDLSIGQIIERTSNQTHSM